MVRKLILSDSGFPAKFNSSNISPPSGISKQQHIENKIIEKINNYNPKLKVFNIEYLKIVEQFPDLDFLGKYSGVLVEDIEIEQAQEEDYRNREYFVWESGNQYYARKIIIHVFIADLQSFGRSSFCQLFFPVLIDFMKLYYSSPSFLIANHPIYFINLEPKDYPESIIKQTAGTVVSDIEYLEVFNTNSKLAFVPDDIRQYLNIFEEDFISSSSIYSSDNFEIDMLNKIAKIKTTKLIVGDYLEIKTNGKYDFIGSSEKFYWIEILPIIFLSIKNGYTIDYTDLEVFYYSNKSLFSLNSDKIERFLILINFVKKLTKGVK